jgi:hypothetical protein
MSAHRTTSSQTPRSNLVELLMVSIYIALTTYLMPTNSAPSLCLIINAAVRPFQITIRARNAGAEQSDAVWRLARLENVVRRSCGER